MTQQWVYSNRLYDSVMGVPSIRLYGFPGLGCHGGNAPVYLVHLYGLLFLDLKLYELCQGDPIIVQLD